MKQNNKIKVVLALLLTGILYNTYSQEKWTLEQCIKYALDNNIQIKQQELDTRVKENALLQSKLNLLPSLNGSYSRSYSAGRALDQTTYEFTEDQTIISDNISTTASVTLFNGFQKLNTIKENKFNLLASVKDFEKFKNDVSLNIAAAYLQILLNTELLNAAKNQQKITYLQVERTEKLVSAGSLPRANLLEIQAQAAAEELQAVNAQNQLDLSYLTLIQLLELDSIKGFEIVIPEIEMPVEEEIVVDVENVFEISQRTLPRVKSAEYKLESSKASLSIARGMRSPQLSFSGSYYTGYSDARQRITGYQAPQQVPIGQTQSGEPVMAEVENPIFGTYPYRDQFSDNASTALSINLSVPIFNGWLVNNSVSNAKISILNSKYNLQYSKNILYREIQQAYADAKAALKKYKASEQALIAMEESFSYTKQRYEVGLVNTVDYNAAQNQLANTRSDLLQSKYEYIFKIKILDFYQGKPLSL